MSTTSNIDQAAGSSASHHPYSLYRDVRKEILENSKTRQAFRAECYSQSRVERVDEISSLKSRCAVSQAPPIDKTRWCSTFPNPDVLPREVQDDIVKKSQSRSRAATIDQINAASKARRAVPPAPSRQPLNIFTEMKTIRTPVEDQDARFDRLEGKVDVLIKLLREQQRSTDLVTSLVDVIQHLSIPVEQQHTQNVTTAVEVDVEEKEVQTKEAALLVVELPELVYHHADDTAVDERRSEEADWGVYSLPSSDDEDEEKADEGTEEDNEEREEQDEEEDELEEEEEDADQEDYESKLARLTLEKLELELLQAKQMLAEALAKREVDSESYLNSIE